MTTSEMSRRPSGTLRQLATMEKPPFILAILLAGLAWALTRYADILDRSPIIEYQILLESREDPPRVTVVLENLTWDKKFSNLKFRLTAVDVKNPRINPIPPASEGDVAPTANGETAQFEIRAFHPGWRFELAANYNASANANVSFRLENSPDTVRLIERSLETFIVRYQALIVAGLVVVWSMVTVFIYIRNTRGANDGNVPQKTQSAGPRN